VSSPRTVVAVDLGAESGRVATVGFDGSALDLTVQHRFTHQPAERDGVLRWDLDAITDGVEAGLGMVSRGSIPVASVGVDTWGVDYGLLGRDGRLVDLPTCYRDERQIRSMAQVLDTVGRDSLYYATGVQILAINTIFALHADAVELPDRLARAQQLLMIPDVLHHRLCGSTVSEYTAASTTGAYDMANGRWSLETLRLLGVPARLMPEVVPAGTDLGPLSDAAGALQGARVIAPPGHDTASAVVGTPLATPDAMYISSGTWSLVGVEVDRPYISATTLRTNLTNEGGYDGTIRLLRNVMGLWILQECRRQWLKEGTDLTYDHIVRLAERERGLRSLIAPDSTVFLTHGDMPRRIRDYCRATSQPVPETVGAVARCVFESLALSYARVAEDITEATGRRPTAVNVVGGGASNRLLSQLTADATGLPVHCGPVEATALGNAVVQLAALGELDGLTQIRQVVAATADIASYLPHPDDAWAQAAHAFGVLLDREVPARDASHLGS
jgi:rhamnulokinase